MRTFITPILAITALTASLVAPRLVSLKVAPTAAEPVVQALLPAPPPTVTASRSSNVGLTVTLDRSVVLAGDVVRAHIEVTAPLQETGGASLPTDLVLVLDRSGSMIGEKLARAKEAALELLHLLGPDDRVSVVSFAEGERVDVPLSPVEPFITGRMINRLQAGGGTHMQAGLIAGLEQLGSPASGRSRRIILLSDGRPDSPRGLDALAHRAATSESPLTTVGIGDNYDPILLQDLADAGTGNAYWANPNTPLAGVFAAEFQSSRSQVATNAQLRKRPMTGVAVVDWGGLRSVPNHKGDGVSLGSLYSGQRRSFWVTLKVDEGVDAATLDLGTFELSWSTTSGDGAHFVADAGDVDITRDPQVAMGGIDKEQWESCVLEEEYNAMLKKVTADLAAGNDTGAAHTMAAYQTKNHAMNAVVRSDVVTANLAEVQRLQDDVRAKKVGKKRVLDLVFSSYQGRRSGSSTLY